MALFSDGGVSSPDIWIVVLMLLISLVGAVLNPLVFRHNLKKKRSLPRDLYLSLSSTDFLSCIILSTTFSLNIVQPKEESCWLKHNNTFCQKEYYKYQRAATLTERAVGCVKWCLIYSPFVITSVLAIARWYQIRFPLRPIRRTAIEATTASICFFYAIFNSVKMLYDSSDDHATMVTAIQNVYIFKIHEAEDCFDISQAAGVLLTLLSTNVASILSIWALLGSPSISGTRQQRSRRRRSSLKIVAMNAGSVVMTDCIIYMILDGPATYRLLNTVALCFLPIFLSVYNSIVYCILTDKLLLNKVQDRIQGY